MGAPRLDWRAIPLQHAVTDTRRVKLWREGDGPAGLGPASVVNMGNPHAVFFVPDLNRIDAGRLGPRIEVDPMFPEKANVTFAEIIARHEVRARVWERGVGLTLACGSAACATLVAAVRLELMDRKGTVRLPGGDLIIEWRGSDDHVLMTGPVEYEGAFILDDALFEAAAP
jgi:diaminopimelate epimerase